MAVVKSFSWSGLEPPFRCRHFFELWSNTALETKIIPLETKIIQLLDSKFSALTQYKQAKSRPTTNDSQYTALQLKEIETAQLYSTPTQRNDDIERVALAQTTKSFSPQPLNMAATIDSVATQGVNSHSHIPTNPTYSHALEGTTSLFAGFHLIPILGDYEAKQQQKQQKQQQQQQQQQQNKWTKHIQRSYIKPDDRSAHLTDTHHKGKWPPPSSS